MNAIVHADYAQQGAPIRIALFDDRIEIENPDPKIFRMGTTAVTTIVGFTPSQGAK